MDLAGEEKSSCSGNYLARLHNGGSMSLKPLINGRILHCAAYITHLFVSLFCFTFVFSNG
jgi:hypothetical protein